MCIVSMGYTGNGYNILTVTTAEAFVYVVCASFVYTVQVMCTQYMDIDHLCFDLGCTWLV